MEPLCGLSRVRVRVRILVLSLVFGSFRSALPASEWLRAFTNLSLRQTKCLFTEWLVVFLTQNFILVSNSSADSADFPNLQPPHSSQYPHSSQCPQHSCAHIDWAISAAAPRGLQEVPGCVEYPEFSEEQGPWHHVQHPQGDFLCRQDIPPPAGQRHAGGGGQISEGEDDVVMVKYTDWLSDRTFARTALSGKCVG